MLSPRMESFRPDRSRGAWLSAEEEEEVPPPLSGMIPCVSSVSGTVPASPVPGREEQPENKRETAARKAVRGKKDVVLMKTPVYLIVIVYDSYYNIIHRIGKLDFEDRK